MHKSGDVFGVEDADDVVGAGTRGIVDGDAGVLFFDDTRAGLLDGHIRGQREDLAAGSHDLANDDVVELDGAVDDLLLKDGEKPHATGSSGDELELFGRVDAAFAAERSTEEPEDEGGRRVHEPDDGRGDADEDIHGPGNGEGDALGSLKREGLGDKLAEEDFEVGNEREGDDDGEGMRVDRWRGEEDVQPVPGETQKDVGDGGLADPAEGKGGEGDSELHGGKKFIDGVLELEDGTAPGRPWAMSCWMRVSRTLTRANSAATKKLLARMKKATRMTRKRIHSSIDDQCNCCTKWI